MKGRRESSSRRKVPQLQHRVNNPHLQHTSCDLSSWCYSPQQQLQFYLSKLEIYLQVTEKNPSGTSKPSSSFSTNMSHSSSKLAELSNSRVSQHERKYRLPAEIWRCTFTEEYITGVRKHTSILVKSPF